MLLKNGEHWFPTEEDIAKWQFSYKNIEVRNELAKADCWLDANPSKRKTERGMRRFVNSWLSRANESRNNIKNTAKSTRSTTLQEDLTDTSWAR